MGAMGVDQYDPKVVNQLLEFIHRQTTEILHKSQRISSLAKKKEVDEEDARPAVEMLRLHSFVALPDRKAMKSMSVLTNQRPLPPTPALSVGEVRLPPASLRP